MAITYERIFKHDGSRQDLTREQVVEQISKHYSLIEEEMGRMDAGHVVATEHAWYQRKFVPGLRGTPSQQETSPEEISSQIVYYGDRFYEVTSDGMDAFADGGAEVAAGETAADAVMYAVLKAEGLDVPEPDALGPNILGALANLHTRAYQLVQTIAARDRAPHDDITALLPRMQETLGAAYSEMGKLHDEAVKSPKLLDQRAAREAVLFERIRLTITAWMMRNDLMTEDVRFYTRSEWTLRGEIVGRDSVLTMTFEGSTLYHVLNCTLEAHEYVGRLEGEFRELLEAHGYYYELGYSWCLSLYPVERGA
ncbi:MAG: hypothetical protein ACJ74Q_15555 [Pyrinomonadaceae bacterium]